MFESAPRHLERAIWKSQEEGWREEWMLWEWKCGESEMAVCKVSGKVGTPSWVLLPLRLLKWRVSNSFCYFAKMSCCCWDDRVLSLLPWSLIPSLLASSWGLLSYAVYLIVTSNLIHNANQNVKNQALLQSNLPGPCFSCKACLARITLCFVSSLMILLCVM